MKHAKGSVALGICILLASAGVALATGQPGSSAGVACTVSPNALQTPGNAGSAGNPAGTSGSPFNQAIAKEYAGNPGSPTTSNGHASSNAVSQYDVACRNVSRQVP
jgi:hypothetical protein